MEFKVAAITTEGVTPLSSLFWGYRHDSSWQEQSLDLSQFAGQAVVFRFTVDASSSRYFSLDDVTIEDGTRINSVSPLEGVINPGMEFSYETGTELLGSTFDFVGTQIDRVIACSPIGNGNRDYDFSEGDGDGHWLTYGDNNTWEYNPDGEWVALVEELPSNSKHYPATRAVLVSPLLVIGEGAEATMNREARFSEDGIKASLELVDAVTQERQVLWERGGADGYSGWTSSTSWNVELSPTTSGTATLQFVFESEPDSYYWRGGTMYYALRNISINPGVCA